MTISQSSHPLFFGSSHPAGCYFHGGRHSHFCFIQAGCPEDEDHDTWTEWVESFSDDETGNF